MVPFLTLYLNESGYSVGRIAWVFVIWAIGGIGAMIAGGRLSDLMGRKNTMSLALISGGISMLFLVAGRHLSAVARGGLFLWPDPRDVSPCGQFIAG